MSRHAAPPRRGSRETALSFLQAGLAAHQAGDIARAEAQYRKALGLQRDHPDALHLLGVLLGGRGQKQEALKLVERAVAAAPGNAVFHNSRGNLLRETGRLAEAIDSLDAAIRLAPAYGEPHLAKGLVLHALGDPGAAASVLEQAATLLPNHPAAQNAHGAALALSGQHEAALACFDRALALLPLYVDALVNRGASLRQLGRLEQAWDTLSAALILDPANAGGWYNAGVLAEALGQREPARAALRWSLRLHPGQAEAWYNLGRLQGEPDAIAHAYGAALTLAPSFRDALFNLADSERVDGSAAAADRHFSWCLVLDPGDAKARWSRALVNLSAGNLSRGWADFAVRFQANNVELGRFAHLPAWQGEELRGRTLLVWPEQGVGDEIVFSTCLPELAAQGARLILLSDPRLVGLLQRSFPQVEVRPFGRETVPDADFQTASGTLAAHLRPALAAFPERAAPLRPDPRLVEHWQGHLLQLGPGLKVGFLWRGRLQTAERSSFYAPLPAMADILRTPGCRFISLQYGEAEAELQAFQAASGIPVVQVEELDLLNDFAGVAALMGALDLIITPGTAAGPLAAALGRPTWMFVGQESWMRLGTERHPWLPSMRLFFRRPRGPWEPVLADIAAELRSLAERS